MFRNYQPIPQPLPVLLLVVSPHDGQKVMSHLQSYPRERSHRGVIPDGSNSTGQQRSPTDDPRAEPSSNGTGTAGKAPRGIDGEQSSHNNGYRSSRGGQVGASSLLAYTYSPLEHSTNTSLLDNWQEAANGLADVVLGEAGSGDIGVAAAGAGGDTQSRTYRLAVKRTILSVLASFAFGFLTMAFRGQQLGLEFLAGYLVEQSLSELISALLVWRPGDVQYHSRTSFSILLLWDDPELPSSRVCSAGAGLSESSDFRVL